jgi:adenosylcobinamide kinase / adenosylcobinamide-phosphate guanylyltransferase
MLTLIIGGARSGKTRAAQSMCGSAARVCCIATAEITDDEMRHRISRHQKDRPKHWLTVEEPLALAGTVETRAPNSDCILIDCLTVWLSNLCWANRARTPDEMETLVVAEIHSVVAASKNCNVIAVTNEVGSGIVPESAVGRLFRDLHGLMNQHAAREADVVQHVVAGIPIQIKPPGGRL